jgi:hypothetical protein
MLFLRYCLQHTVLVARQMLLAFGEQSLARFEVASGEIQLSE